MRKWLLSIMCVLVALSLCEPVALARGAQPLDTGVTWNLGPTFPSNTGNVPTVVPTQDTQIDFDIPSYAAIGWEVYSGDGDTVDINLVPAAQVSSLRQSCASATATAYGTASPSATQTPGETFIVGADQPSSGSGGFPWLAVLLGLVVVAGLGGGGVLYLMRRKREG